MNNFIRKNNQYLVLFITSLLIFIVFALMKDEFHMDEILSISIGNGLESQATGYFMYDVTESWLPRESFKIFNANEHAFDFQRVYQSYSFDNHPPLFGYVTHFMSSIFPSKLSHYLFYIPNYIFMIISSIISCALTNKITKNSNISLLTLFVSLFSVVIIKDTLFIRMYALCNLMVVSTLFISYELISTTGYKLYVPLLYFCVFLGSLTHYYYYIFLAGLALTTAVYLIYEKKYKLLTICSFVVIAAVLTSFHYYPAAVNSLLNSTHTSAAISNVETSDTFMRIIYQFKNLPMISLFTILMIVALFYLILRKKVSYDMKWLLSIFCFYFIIVSKISTYVTHRYMIPINSLYVIIIAVIIKLFIDEHKEYTNIIYGLIVISLFCGYINNGFDFNNTIKWAKNHSNLDAIVISNEGVDFNTTNSMLFDLREYNSVWFTNLKTNDGTLLDRELIFYLGNEYDIDYIENFIEPHKENYELLKIDDYINNGYQIYSYRPFK